MTTSRPRRSAKAGPLIVADLNRRASGVLLHPTSLPGPHGAGDLGAEAHRFVDWLARAAQAWWQMLPVGPPGYGNSPYSAESAFAGSPWLVDADAVGGDRQRQPNLAMAPGRAAFGNSRGVREAALRAAFARFAGQPRRARAFDAFCAAERAWLDDYALFAAIKRAHGDVEWTRWPEPLRARRRPALAEARRTFHTDIDFHRFVQWQFAEQWRALRQHAAAARVRLLGDLPIFVAHDSADVWTHPDLFELDSAGLPAAVAGVPPDYFSRTGQRWGNPLYRWPVHRRSGYAWWIARLRGTLARFDAVRLDHFIGFHRFWRIPASCPTAIEGEWRPGPGAHFFRAVAKALGALPLVAEDLGLVTPEVKALRDRFELPGIRILQFAFGDDPSAPDFVPHAYPRRTVAYTGTHDNDTTVGWFRERAGVERDAALAYLGTDGREIHWDMIRMVQLSVANLAIFPLQDVLGLGSEARMNLPGTASGNWEWRVRSEQLDDGVADRLAGMTRLYGRAP